VTSEELESKKLELDREIRRAEIALRENELPGRHYAPMESNTGLSHALLLGRRDIS